MAGHSPWRIGHLELRIELDLARCTVTATSTVEPVVGAADGPLVLDGRGLELVDLHVDGNEVPAGDRDVTDRALTLHLAPGTTHTVTTVSTLVPGGVGAKGIWQLDGVLASNCEPQGFRRITWSLDRPDNRATFDVTLVADAARFPVLLSNGDAVGAGQDDDGRLWARFVDPIPKPSYLFALVAGHLAFASRSYISTSGRRMQLRVAAPSALIDGAAFALDTLADAMRFDERHGGVEHDLDVQTFVALPGYPDATEYHGLMFFDPALLVVDTRGFVDDDLLLIAANVAHEYGHHTRGNRVTVRSWGQLALKEGLTVLTAQNDFRRHLLGPAARVLDVADLRRLQYPEELTIGQPVMRGEVDDPTQLYTRTTYLKGAEIFSMLRVLAGPQRWAQAFTGLVAAHDLDAAGVDDMLAALRAAAPDQAADIDAIGRWFTLAGRPALEMRREVVDGVTILHVDRTDALRDDPPVAMPLALRAFDAHGEAVSLGLDGEPPADAPVAVLRGRTGSFELRSGAAATAPLVIAPLRGFSSPVDLVTDLDDAELAVLLAHDDDPFTRWWAGEELMIRAVDAHRRDDLDRADAVIDVLADTIAPITGREDDLLLLAQLLGLPDEHMLGDRDAQIDVDGVGAGLAALRHHLGAQLHDRLLAVLDRSRDADAGGTSSTDIAARWLVEPALGLLLAAGTDDAIAAARTELGSSNPTRAVRALGQLAHLDLVDLDPLLEHTYRRWEGAPKLVDRWIRAQTGARRSDTVERVRALAAGPLYDRGDRGRVMAVWFPFATRNRQAFHRRTGEGYRVFVDELIELMPSNAGIAIRLVGDLLQYRRFDPQRRELLRAELERVAGAPGMPDFAVAIVRSLLDAP